MSKEYIVPLSEDEAFYGYKGVAVELVRCKDCKYYRIYKNADWTVELCGRIRTTMADPVKEDDYCSKAERKDNETD